MAYVVSRLLIVLVVPVLVLEAYPSSGGQNTQNAQELEEIRELIAELRTLKTREPDVGAESYDKPSEEKRQGSGKTEIKQGKGWEGKKSKDQGKTSVPTENKEKGSLTRHQKNGSRRPAGRADSEEEEQDDVTVDTTGKIALEHLAKKKTNKMAGDKGKAKGKRNGGGMGRGVDIDRTVVNPNSEIAHLFAQMEVNIKHKKIKPAGLHAELLEKNLGDSRDSHPTPHPPKEPEELTIQGAEKKLARRNFLKTGTLWTNGVVPYELDEAFSQQQIQIIEGALEEMRQKTCVNFQPRNQVTDTLDHSVFVMFNFSTSGCWSFVGRVKATGQQDIGLGPGCVNHPTIIHEMCHAIGMEHEQSRADRDHYVDMIWDNIVDGQNNVNMKKTKTKDVNPYDYESILQYSVKDGGKYVMRFKDNAELEFLADSATGLTFYDVKDITSAYGCTEHCPSDVPTCQNGGFIDHNCDCLCPSERLYGEDCSNILTDEGCGGVVDVTGGPQPIVSPNYPQDYEVGASCTWLVKGPIGKVLQLTINSLELSYDTYTDRCYHWLEIRYNLMGQTGIKLCGDFTDEIYKTTWDGTHNLLYLHFDSAFASDKSPSKGFQLTVEAVPPGCASSPCIHGSCQDDPTTEYICVCDDNYEGVHCDQVKASASFSCGFEDPDICFFKNEERVGEDTFDWTWHKGPTHSSGTGPSQAYNGEYYMYVEVSGRVEGNTASLISSESLPVGLWCLSFWYHMYGLSLGKLEVLGAADRTVWWSDSTNHGDQWNYISVEMPLSTSQKVELLATVGWNWQGDIAIDDLHLQPCVPVTPAPVIEVHDRCDFEDFENDCFLNQALIDDFDWIVDQTGGTPTSKTGPTSAQEGSRYAYIEASDVFDDDMAVLQSTSTYPAGEYCLTFSYHMYGLKMGFLEVSTSLKSGNEYAVFLKTGDQGQQWNHGVVSVKESGEFSLLFAAFRGTSYSSDAALDNIYFTSDKCGCQSNPCLNGGSCLPDASTKLGYQCNCPPGLNGVICDVVSADTPLTCTFETDTPCFLQQSMSDTFDWTIKEGPTATQRTGPSGAAVGDFYAYIETSGLITAGDVATFTTAPMEFEDGSRCLTFLYHMYGNSTGSLVVNYGGQTYGEQGNQGDSWFQISFGFDMSGTAELTITASVEQNRAYGDIAIDDVRLTPGPCN